MTLLEGVTVHVTPKYGRNANFTEGLALRHAMTSPPDTQLASNQTRVTLSLTLLEKINGILLGDNGYALSEHLLMPLLRLSSDTTVTTVEPGL